MLRVSQRTPSPSVSRPAGINEWTGKAWPGLFTEEFGRASLTHNSWSIRQTPARGDVRMDRGSAPIQRIGADSTTSRCSS
ncbi:MAG: hypothetical protein DWQ29_19075 [Planctomycetota bacterium]|nr:MAG: hypothetical protein DWQ29_19075 [Planctomycetota bacterium]